ncbi:MAG: cation:proton antiporter subunit C [Deltaproteobacteria bacterium]|nr:cation:proton antiporter subunit C [Deltaproteobacteria bacterium]
MMTGLHIVIARRNYVKKLMGLSIFQVSVIMLYVTMGKVAGGTAPVYVMEGEGHDAVPNLDVVYSNPVPHVLMLTAIVVGIATMALGLALVVRIKESYGTVEDDVVIEKDRAEEESLES